MISCVRYVTFSCSSSRLTSLVASTLSRMVSPTTLRWVRYSQCDSNVYADFVIAARLLPTIRHRLVTSVFDLAFLFGGEAASSLILNTNETRLRRPYDQTHLPPRDQPTKIINGPLRKGRRSAIDSSQLEFSRVCIVPTRTDGGIRRLRKRSRHPTKITRWHRVRATTPWARLVAPTQTGTGTALARMLAVTIGGDRSGWVARYARGLHGLRMCSPRPSLRRDRGWLRIRLGRGRRRISDGLR